MLLFSSVTVALLIVLPFLFASIISKPPIRSNYYFMHAAHNICSTVDSNRDQRLRSVVNRCFIKDYLCPKIPTSKYHYRFVSIIRTWTFSTHSSLFRTEQPGSSPPRRFRCFSKHFPGRGLGTFFTSVVGVILFSILLSTGGISTSPDCAGIPVRDRGVSEECSRGTSPDIGPPEAHQELSRGTDQFSVYRIYVSVCYAIIRLSEKADEVR